MMRIGTRTRFAVSIILCILPFAIIGTCAALDLKPLKTGNAIIMCIALFTMQALGMLLLVKTMDRHFDLGQPKS